MLDVFPTGQTNDISIIKHHLSIRLLVIVDSVIWQSCTLMCLFVVFSLWELGSKADGKLSVVRAFYVLRFVRVFHFLPYLKRQLLVLKRTIREASTLCWLMLFVIFIFRYVSTHQESRCTHLWALRCYIHRLYINDRRCLLGWKVKPIPKFL